MARWDDDRGPASSPAHDVGVASTFDVPVTWPIDTVLVRDESAIVHLTGAVVHRDSLAFQVTAVVAPGGRERSLAAPPGTGRLGRQDLQLMLGVEFADGRTAHNYGPPGRRQGTPRDPVRLSASGDHGAGRAVLHCRLSPLPPGDHLTVVVAWPARGVAERASTVFLGDLAAAAARVDRVTLTPAPPEPDGGSPPPTMPVDGWFAEHLGLTDDHRG